MKTRIAARKPSAPARKKLRAGKLSARKRTAAKPSSKPSSKPNTINTMLEHFTPSERKLLMSLNTPQKIQEFLDKLPTNWEPEGDTVLSPRRVLRERRAHCIEAAMFAALCLRLQGEKPLILDLTANNDDQDHVLAVFRRNGCWGAIAKSNHYCLGYRDPVYRTPRELVMSYFHEYLNYAGKKTLRSFSQPIDLSRFDSDDLKKSWVTADKDVWAIPSYIIHAPHTRLMTKTQEKNLRAADKFTERLNNITRQQKPKEK